MTHETNLNWRLATIALHAGEEEKFADSHTMPIFSTSTFSFPNADVGRARFAGEEEGYIYTRLGNPTVNASEKKIAFLEGSTLMKKGIHVEGHAFSTGMSAIATTLMALTESGRNIISTNPVYGGTNYLYKVLKPFNVSTTFVNTAGEQGLEEVSEAINEKTRVIYLESPANPNLAVCDIHGISKIAKEHDLPVVVDNTFATPILQRPLELGADISLHSTTKYLNGHGTTVSGILASRLPDKRAEKLKFVKKNLGATQSPFDGFLVLNGMKTLPLRMEKHCTNAQIIAEYLLEHPKIANVHYPGLTSHPQHALAKEQMNGRFGGMVAFELKGGLEAGKVLMNSVEILTLAVSLGCIDSLIQHPASMTHASVPKDVRLQGGITDGLVRISVGLEDPDDLIEDLSQALDKTN
ncbi:MAG: aminotransferase class I/II-fold pyridoxal phosphate-dependent enzyme [Candidatus Heimdallarchaeota archaeon]|nr:aminotransferase class I/II-fold pyridoxal phosphate-dependent enzyme [Candidatus Heimdallarchaeota archaeon]